MNVQSIVRTSPSRLVSTRQRRTKATFIPIDGLGTLFGVGLVGNAVSSGEGSLDEKKEAFCGM